VGIVIHGDFVIGLSGETRETIERTIEFAKELDTQTIQVSVAHAFPGTQLYECALQNNFLASEAAMNRFYDTYYFRPRVVWRIVREALWDGDERRLYHEAVGYLRVRAERRKYARDNSPKPSMVAVSGAHPGSKPAART
jgi:radical SAM superfamily enzyme YgiQ (UPF0313 family)